MEGGKLAAAALGLEPAAHAFVLHHHGEGLVEGGVVLGVDQLVRELVEYQPRHLRLGVADECREQRVVEPAEGRVGEDAADVDVVALRTQLFGVALGVVLGEEAAIGDAAGEGEAFLVRLDRELRHREHVPHGITAAEIGIRGVARVVRQVQIPRREFADALRRLQARFQVCRRRRVGEPGVDRPRRREQMEVAADRLRVVRERFAACEQRQKEEQRYALHAKRPERRNCAMSAATRPETVSILWASRTSA